MNNRVYFQVIVVSLLLFGGGLSCAKLESRSPGPDALSANSPASASYLLENDWIQLENGRAEWQAAPGSASKTKVALFGETAYNDLNNDGNEDAVIFLTYQGGGSGTFFYLGAALLENGKFRGINGIWLGDRIGPPKAFIKNGLITVEYLDRSPDESMTTTPSVEQKRYFILNHSILHEIQPAADEAVYQGWLILGHEVRSFLPCNEKDELWLAGNSPALAEIITAYRETMTDSPPYTPVYTILSGRKTAPPKDGFGAEYKQAIFTSKLIHLWLKGNCKSDLIFLDSPLPGTHISSPLTIKGRARGTWFFEGDFPVILLDAQGKKIAESYATAKSQWMTEDFVEFEGTLEFNGSVSGQKGSLILRKDNPTGLAKFDDFLEIPVSFNQGGHL